MNSTVRRAKRYGLVVCSLAAMAAGALTSCDDDRFPTVRSCGEYGFNRSDEVGQVYFFTPDPVPIDARPWLFVDCSEEIRDCALVSDAHAVQVDIERAQDCDVSLCDVVTFSPHEPLQPGHSYTLSCENFDVVGVAITTRGDATPAVPPGEVMVDGADNDDGLGLRFPPYSLSAPYLREGGRIELAYPDGGVLPITHIYTGDPFPASEGPLVLTPVAADGLRGDSVTVEPTSSGCTISPERSSAWLLLFLWALRRSRRPARDA